jgi:glutamate synthase domain-containing protein 1
MKNNNLSNRSAPSILIRVEDFLVEYKEKSVWDKVANFVVGKEKRAKINVSVLIAMHSIFRNTDMSVDLVIEEKNCNAEVLELLYSLPYGRLVKVSKPVQIAVKLNVGEYLYYVDNDLERISIIGHKRCITLDTLILQLRGGFKFE